MERRMDTWGGKYERGKAGFLERLKKKGYRGGRREYPRFWEKRRV